jgi:hypothetical protein
MGLAASVEESEVPVDGLGFVAISLADADGVVAVDADRLVTVAVAGDAELVALGTGRIRTEESFSGPSVTTHDGRALAIVRPTGPGVATVTVTARAGRSIRLPDRLLTRCAGFGPAGFGRPVSWRGRGCGSRPRRRGARGSAWCRRPRR